jgi:hypothetical protein
MAAAPLAPNEARSPRGSLVLAGGVIQLPAVIEQAGRKAYGTAVGRFLAWCEERGLTLERLEPFLLACYVEEISEDLAAPSVSNTWPLSGCSSTIWSSAPRTSTLSMGKEGGACTAHSRSSSSTPQRRRGRSGSLRSSRSQGTR